MQNIIKLKSYYGFKMDQETTDVLNLFFADLPSDTDPLLAPIKVPDGTDIITSFERYFKVFLHFIDSGNKLTNFKVTQGTISPQTGLTLFYKNTDEYNTPTFYTYPDWQVTHSYSTIQTDSSTINSNLTGELQEVNDTTSFGVLVLQVASNQTTSQNNIISITYDEKSLNTLGTWVTTSNLTTQRYWLAGCGIQNQALSIGGQFGVNQTQTNIVERFTDSSWSQIQSMLSKRGEVACFGTSTQAIQYGGLFGYTSVTPFNTSESYNNISWSSSASFSSGVYESQGCGTQSQGFKIGGALGLNDTNRTKVTQTFDGTAWSSQINLNYSKGELQACGTTAQALQFGGCINNLTTASNIVELFNGSSWQIQNYLSSARTYLGGCGISNSALQFGGSPNSGSGSSSITEKFNGDNWVTKSNLIVARRGLAGCGTQNQGFSFGGVSCNSEYYNEE